MQVKPLASGIDQLLRQVLLLQSKNEDGPVLEVRINHPVECSVALLAGWLPAWLAGGLLVCHSECLHRIYAKAFLAWCAWLSLCMSGVRGEPAATSLPSLQPNWHLRGKLRHRGAHWGFILPTPGLQELLMEGLPLLTHQGLRAICDASFEQRRPLLGALRTLRLTQSAGAAAAAAHCHALNA